jgi:hypothetical protein
MKNDPHRQHCQRQHRIVGHYLALQAWLRGIDCIVLRRIDLMRFLDLDRFKSARIKWLQADLKPWFPYQKPYFSASAPSSISTLFLARVPIDSHLPRGRMTAPQLIAGIAATGPRTEAFLKFGAPVFPPGEQDIIRDLCLLATGLTTPTIYNPNDGA